MEVINIYCFKKGNIKIMVRVTCMLMLFFLICQLYQITLITARISAGSQLEGSVESIADHLGQKEYDREPGNTNLRLVQVIYRHGDRSPLNRYSNDVYNESDWPQGYGQLSHVGMKQEYFLGHFLRRRYMIDSDFMSPSYVKTEIYVRSTAYNRALMSAYSVLAGLYPPVNEDHRWNTNISWQPIPVHTIYPSRDDAVLFTNMSCPNFLVKQEQFVNAFIVENQISERFSDLFKLVSKDAGAKESWYGVRKVFDPLFCQNKTGYKLPNWVTDEAFKQILHLRDTDARLSCPPHLAYLKAGLLVGDMLDHMINKSKNNISAPQKMFMYSAHDTNIVCLLNVLGVYNDKQPPYTACVIIELLEGNPGEFYVQVSYKNNTVENAKDSDADGEPYVLTLPNCDKLCPLEKFTELVKSSIPRDLQTECGSSQEVSFSQKSFELSSIFNTVMISLIVVGLVIFVILCFLLRKSRDSHDYMPVPLEMT